MQRIWTALRLLFFCLGGCPSPGKTLMDILLNGILIDQNFKLSHVHLPKIYSFKATKGFEDILCGTRTRSNLLCQDVCLQLPLSVACIIIPPHLLNSTWASASPLSPNLPPVLIGFLRVKPLWMWLHSIGRMT